MANNDNQQYITVELYNAGNDRLEKRIIQLSEKQDSSFQALKAEIQTVRENTLINGAKIDAYKDFSAIWFTVIAVIIALVGLFAPLLRDIYKDAKMNKTMDKIKEAAREVMREEIKNTVREFLKTSGVSGK